MQTNIKWMTTPDDMSQVLLLIQKISLATNKMVTLSCSNVGHDDVCMRWMVSVDPTTLIVNGTPKEVLERLTHYYEGFLNRVSMASKINL